VGLWNANLVLIDHKVPRESELCWKLELRVFHKAIEDSLPTTVVSVSRAILQRVERPSFKMHTGQTSQVHVIENITVCNAVVLDLVQDFSVIDLVQNDAHLK